MRGCLCRRLLAAGPDDPVSSPGENSIGTFGEYSAGAHNLESGGYSPQLQPYFLKPYFRRLTYRLTSTRSERPTPGSIQSTRGATGFGEFDIAYVADRPALAMSITDTGLPDCCLTMGQRGALECRSGSHEEPIDVGPSTGLLSLNSRCNP